MVSEAELLDLTLANIPLTVNRTVVTNTDITKEIQKLADKPITLQSGGHNEYNTKCEVHMPGQTLSNYNDILLLEDACSDALQSSLRDGWRIIAACPQPNQRRPDYILGRFNPADDLSNSANRG